MSITLVCFSCKPKKKKTFEEEAMELIKQVSEKNHLENQRKLKGINFSEGVREIIEWHEDDYILKSKYPRIRTIKSTEDFKRIASDNPQAVKAIYLDNYDTTIVFKSLSIFSNLEYLKVRSLDSIPNGFYKLEKLKVFEAANELKCKMDERISNLRNLEVLKLSFTHLELPESISKLEKLTVLNFYNFNYDQPFNKIYEIPNLKTLRIKYSNAEQLEGISKLKKLKTFVTNKVSPEVGKLNLTGLYIGENSDEKYPKELANLKDLVAFYWQGNNIRKSPPEFVSSLNKLEYLEIRGCSKFESIPQELDNLINLKQFDIICRPKFTGQIEHLNVIKNKINIK